MFHVKHLENFPSKIIAFVVQCRYVSHETLYIVIPRINLYKSSRVFRKK